MVAGQSTASPVYRRTIIKLIKVKSLRFWYRSTYLPETHRLVPKSLKLDKQRQSYGSCDELGSAVDWGVHLENIFKYCKNLNLFNSNHKQN
jgi:hypothetical protein